jgi:signal transduction histidine kinase/ActR/RegA family two-component response regulator
MIPPGARLEFAGDRVAEFLSVLEQMAAGDMRQRLKISPRHDELDALAHAVNVLVGELEWTTARAVEAHQERAAAAERANASKNTFLRNMSHEVRTPIAAMLGFANLLASRDLPPEERAEFLRRLRTNGQAVLSLLDDLLDLAKLDAHKIVLHPESVSVVDLAREVVSSLEVDSRAKGLEMRVEATGLGFDTIWTDRYRLRQILVNVVVNAVKFTPAGSVVVALSAMRDAAGERWTIDITDTGIGIAADRHTRLFEPFEQVDASVSSAYDGHGLGLSLSRRLADHLGGSLALLHSVPGAGTAFRLTLRPLPGAPETRSAPNGEALIRQEHSIEGLRTLLAEDHRDLHIVLRGLLEEAGAVVESAYDGQEAVDKAISGAFDVILMDLRMPRLDGLQATRALRSRGCAVTVIALTADPATVRRAEALKAGCDACLSKPFEIEELATAIRLSSRSAPIPRAAKQA